MNNKKILVLFIIALTLSAFSSSGIKTMKSNTYNDTLQSSGEKHLKNIKQNI
ncbi:MAG: hypothetical protein ABI792_00145 [bacterium]